MPKSQTNCTIVSSFRTDIHRVEKLLDELSVKVKYINISFSKTLVTDAVKNADCLIFFIDEADPYIYYVLGMADGMNKPNLVLFEGDSLPKFTEGRFQQKVTSINLDVIAISITRFIKEVQSNRPLRKRPKKNYPKLSTERLDLYLADIKKIRIKPSEHLIEQLLVRLFKELLITTEVSKARDQGADLATFFTDDDNSMSSVVIIEIKSRSRMNTRIINESQDKLLKYLSHTQEYLSGSQVLCGLLLFLDASGNQYQSIHPKHNNIVIYEIESFVRELSVYSFPVLISNALRSNTSEK
jgi:hypothetical protein